MKNIILTFLLMSIIIFSAFSQNEHKINAGFDFSLGPYYFDSDINNPTAYSVFIGYEYDVLEFLGLELGLKYGGFSQKIGYDRTDVVPPLIDDKYLAHDVYRGTIFSPYISSKLLFDVGSSDARINKYLFLENRLLYTFARIDLDRIGNFHSVKNKNNIDYEIRFGYIHPINKRWNLSCWGGYSTFDFSRIDPKNIRFKNSTPIQFGVGFGYLLSNR